MSDNGWVGFDLDGTLAVDYEGKFDPNVIGAPVQRMVDVLFDHLDKGIEVRIFTARVSGPLKEAALARAVIDAWCVEHFDRTFAVTCTKDYKMRYLYDDRAREVHRNTGVTLNETIEAQAKLVKELSQVIRNLQAERAGLIAERDELRRTAVTTPAPTT